MKTNMYLHDLYHNGDINGLGLYEALNSEENQKFINQPDKTSKLTLLQKACFHGQTQLVEYLLTKEINPLEINEKLDCFDLLSYSPSKNSGDIFKLILKKYNTAFENLGIDRKVKIIKQALESNNADLIKTILENTHSREDIIKETITSSLDKLKDQFGRLEELDKEISKCNIVIYNLENISQEIKTINDDIVNYTKLLAAEKKSPTNQDYIRRLERNLKVLNTQKEQITAALLNKNIDTEISNLKKKLSPYLSARERIIQEQSRKNELQKIKLIPENFLERDISNFKNAILEGNLSKVEFLLESGISSYNTPINGQSILNLALEKIKQLEEKLLSEKDQGKKQNYQDTINGIYSSLDLLLDKPNFNLSAVLNEQKSPPFINEVYANFKESPKEFRYHKQKLFEKLYNHKDTQNYLIDINSKTGKENGFELLKDTARYNDSHFYFKTQDTITNLPDAIDQQEILFNAAQSGSKKIFDTVFDVDLLKNKPTSNNKTQANLLMAACKGGNYEIVKEILSKKDVLNISINAVDNYGNTALHYLANSSSHDNIDIIQDLIKKGSNIEVTNKLGHTALISAVLTGNTTLIKELLQKGANVNAVDKAGNNPLIYAVSSNNKETIEAILSASNLNVTHKNNRGISAYSISISRDITSQATENDPSLSQDTKKNEYPNLSSSLLKRGADPYQVSQNTILDVAFTTTLAVSAVKASNILADVVKNTPFSAAGGILKTLTFFGASVAVQQTAKNYIIGLLNDATTKNSTKLSLKEEVMIGSIHKGFFIKSGESLRQDMLNHSNFKDVKDGIYTIGDLTKRIEDFKKNRGDKTEEEVNKFNDWALKAQQALQDKFVTATRRIEDRSLSTKVLDYIVHFREQRLQASRIDILEASKLIIKHAGGKTENDNKTFEEICPDLVSQIKPPADKNLLRNIIDGSGKDIESLIQDVIEKKILVSPETYLAFSQFDQMHKRICQNDNTINNFKSEVPQSSSFSIAVIDDSAKEDLAKLKNNVDKIVKNSTNPIIPKKTWYEQSLELAETVTENAQTVINKALTPTAKEALSVTGATLFAAGAMFTATEDPATLQKYTLYSTWIQPYVSGALNATIGAIGSTLYNTPSAISSGLNSAYTFTSSATGNISATCKIVGDAIVANPVTALAVGAVGLVAVAGYYMSQDYNTQSSQSTATLMAKIGPTSIIDLPTASQVNAINTKNKNITRNVFSTLWSSHSPSSSEKESATAKEPSERSVRNWEKLTSRLSEKTSHTPKIRATSENSSRTLSIENLTTRDTFSIQDAGEVMKTLGVKEARTRSLSNTSTASTASMSTTRSKG